MEFTFSVVGQHEWDRDDDNVDVEVLTAEGRYTATFFTIRNIQSLFEKNRISGECRGGLYFWASKMIIVEHLTEAAIHDSIEDLLREGEFQNAFARVE